MPLCKLKTERSMWLKATGPTLHNPDSREKMSGAALRWLMMMVLPSGLSAVAGDAH